jgi:septal ring factor EnvC (AmiA/AmiB activator)
MDKKSDFPYKTLIWVLFAVIALFAFKPELKQLLGDAEELSVFGVNIKAGKEKVKKLEQAIQNFNLQVTQLSDEIAAQQSRIATLNKLKTTLEKELVNCPGAQKTTATFNREFTKVYAKTNALKVQSDKLKNIKILDYSKLIKNYKN